MTDWRAGCAERCKSGSEGGGWKSTIARWQLAGRPPYVTRRGKSAFSKELEKRGVRQVVASPRHPQTLGKIERFWGTLWRECVEAAVFLDLGDARTRVGLFIDHYNFQRPHRAAGGLVPADRFFGAAPEVLRPLTARVAAHALRPAPPRAPHEPRSRP